MANLFDMMMTSFVFYPPVARDLGIEAGVLFGYLKSRELLGEWVDVDDDLQHNTALDQDQINGAFHRIADRYSANGHFDDHGNVMRFCIN